MICVVLQEELVSARGNVCALMQQNADLKEKLERTSDYATMQKEHAELQAKVHLLKKQLEESQEEKQRLRQGKIIIIIIRDAPILVFTYKYLFLRTPRY